MVSSIWQSILDIIPAYIYIFTELITMEDLEISTKLPRLENILVFRRGFPEKPLSELGRTDSSEDYRWFRGCGRELSEHSED